MLRKISSLWAALVSAAMATSFAQAASFQGLGDLPGGIFESRANAVSADGSVVVGVAKSAEGIEAFRWTQSDGMIGLGDLVGRDVHSRAFGVSANGAVVVGYGEPASGGTEAFRWTQSDGVVGLGDLPGGAASSAANDVSADGTVVTGTGVTDDGFEAWRWTEASGMVAIRGNVLGDGHTAARAISDDGSVIVGFLDTDTVVQPFRWSSDGLQTLGNFPGADRGEARSVSADGQVVIGHSGYQAFRWKQADGMAGLGDLPGGDLDSWAHGASADGSVIVGQGTSADGLREAFIWDASHGMRRLQDVLTNEYGLGPQLAGWTLGSTSPFPGPDGTAGALGISNDGRTIVGWGTNPDGELEAWVATVPEPSSLVLAIVGIGWLATYRRSRDVLFSAWITPRKLSGG